MEKTEQKTKAFNFILMAILMTCLLLIKGQFSLQKLSVVTALQASEKHHNLSVDLSADDGIVLGGRWYCSVVQVRLLAFTTCFV